MANTHTITLPDEVEAFADKLAKEGRLSKILAEYLLKLQEVESRRT